MTSFSPLLVAVLVVVGFAGGIIYDLLSGVKFLTRHNIIVSIVADICACICVGFGFIYAIFAYAEGAFALFELISLLLGLIIEQFFVKNLWTRLFNRVYNNFTSHGGAKHRRKKYDTSKTRKLG